MAPAFSSSAYPLVSAVIPTRGRPDLLACAVASALQQTWPNLEVVVVVDGPDPATAAGLAAFADRRVRTVFLSESRGAADARNAGVLAAKGDWIAFLDDDDEWLPGKIARQMRTARNLPDWFPVVSSRVIARSPSTSRVLPVRPYRAPQPIADFLFCRNSLREPGGVMQCSTLLAPRELLLAIPFQSGLPMHQDWDWLIRVASHKGVGLAMVREPLAVWRVEDDRATVGRTPDWEFSLAWIRSLRPLISRAAFSWFVAVECAWRAQASHAGLLARLLLLRAFLREGQPELRSFLSFLLFSLVPRRLRRSMRKGVLRHGAAPDVFHGLHLVHSRPPVHPVFRKSSR
jgi:glycosyltransferase involved in cell wall biosynthesis